MFRCYDFKRCFWIREKFVFLRDVLLIDKNHINCELFIRFVHLDTIDSSLPLSSLVYYHLYDLRLVFDMTDWFRFANRGYYPNRQLILQLDPIDPIDNYCTCMYKTFYLYLTKYFRVFKSKYVETGFKDQNSS